MTVKTGLQVFLDNKVTLCGDRVGLITHPAAVLPDLTHALDAFISAGIKIEALFGPEHGYLGFEADAQQIDHSVDSRTGLPAYSLYGEHLAPTAEMLADVDLLIFDMQDVGTRFYTFISTLFYVLKAAGECRKRLIVLDRPNPLDGERIEGALLERGFESFVGIAPLAAIHGLTVGEIAAWMNDQFDFDTDLQVVPMQGWRRAMDFRDTGLHWVPTSPGMPQLSTVFLYPCTCLIEGTNLSEGRGTPLPFEVMGAPDLDEFRLAETLNRLELKGVRFRPTVFKPLDSKHTGQICRGIQVHLTDRRCFQPLTAGLHLLRVLLDIYPQFSFLETSWEGVHPHIDLLMGSSQARIQLLAGSSVAEITAEWARSEKAFRAERKPYLLYD